MDEIALYGGAAIIDRCALVEKWSIRPTSVPGEYVCADNLAYNLLRSTEEKEMEGSQRIYRNITESKHVGKKLCNHSFICVQSPEQI